MSDAIAAIRAQRATWLEAERVRLESRALNGDHPAVCVARLRLVNLEVWHHRGERARRG